MPQVVEGTTTNQRQSPKKIWPLDCPFKSTVSIAVCSVPCASFNGLPQPKCSVGTLSGTHSAQSSCCLTLRHSATGTRWSGSPWSIRSTGIAKSLTAGTTACHPWKRDCCNCGRPEILVLLCNIRSILFDALHCGVIAELPAGFALI